MPKVSVLIPVYKTNVDYLKNAILDQYIKQDGFEKSWGYRK